MGDFRVDAEPRKAEFVKKTAALIVGKFYICNKHGVASIYLSWNGLGVDNIPKRTTAQN